jgi:hypothetical protein
MALTRRTTLKLGSAALGALALPSGFGRALAAGEVETHGLSTFGELALPADFPHFAYVNPQAPRGGLLSIQIKNTSGNQNFETFDTLNIFVFKGDGAAGMDTTFDTLMAGLGHQGRWWKREWLLGDIERVVRHDPDGQEVRGLAGRLGWFVETASSDIPPPYDPATHTWSEEPAQVREGALALFYVDLGSQVVAVTSAAGEVSVPGLCRALEDILTQAEMDRRRSSPTRRRRSCAPAVRSA